MKPREWTMRIRDLTDRCTRVKANVWAPGEFVPEREITVREVLPATECERCAETKAAFACMLEAADGFRKERDEALALLKTIYEYNGVFDCVANCDSDVNYHEPECHISRIIEALLAKAKGRAE